MKKQNEKWGLLALGSAIGFVLGAAYSGTFEGAIGGAMILGVIGFLVGVQHDDMYSGS